MENHSLTSTPAIHMHAHTHENMHTHKHTHHTHMHMRREKMGQKNILVQSTYIKRSTQGATFKDFSLGYHKI